MGHGRTDYLQEQASAFQAWASHIAELTGRPVTNVDTTLDEPSLIEFVATVLVVSIGLTIAIAQAGVRPLQARVR